MEECIRRGQPPPEGIQNAPVLYDGLNLYYTAFLDLHGCRQLGTVLGPIDWLAIDRYCERHEIMGEQYEDMHYFVARMDEAFLKNHRDKADKANKAALGKAKSGIKKAPVRRRAR